MKKNKRIQCPYCKKCVRDVIEVDVRVPIYYYINRELFGNAAGPYFNILSLKRNKKYHKILSFNCRFCGQSYPDKMRREIWKHLKYRKILADLKKD